MATRSQFRRCPDRPMPRSWSVWAVVACFVSFTGSVASAHEGPHDGEHAHTHAEDAPLPPGGSFFTTRDQPKVLPLPKDDAMFQFIIYGDRTGGVPAGLAVLEQAVVDTNLLDPDLVMTVGDLIQGYNEKPEWMRQMQEYKDIMDRLRMRWFPVAGNHDVYWRGQGPAPKGQHDSNYEAHFGPLWYTFAHKNAGFVILYSDEGDPVTNEKNFNVARLQRMSDAQLAFLDAALAQHRDCDHVFVFLHHPRWIGRNYEGGNWDVVHDKLIAAGNVSAVFAGHIHHLRYDGPETDPTNTGIEYHTLATTGGHLAADIPGAGYLHHMNIVTVRPDRVSVTALPVGAAIDPKEFTKEFITETELARGISPSAGNESVLLEMDGSAAGEVTFTIANPCTRPVQCTLSLDGINRDWLTSLDHDHFTLEPGQVKTVPMTVQRLAGNLERMTNPRVRLDVVYEGETTRVAMPETFAPIRLDLAAVPADSFTDAVNLCLAVDGEQSVVRVNADDVALPDGPFTLECWIAPSQSPGYVAVIAKTQGSEYAFFLDEGVPQFDVHLSGRYVTATARDVLQVDQWTHLAGVFDGEMVSLFVNGKRIDQKPGRGPRSINTLPLFLGADPDVGGRPTRPFRGKLDEVRLTTGAVYRDDFQPERRLQPLPESVLMMHLDRRIGPFVLDHSGSATKGILGASGQLVAP